MKLQDKHKYDSLPLGIERRYIVDFESNFFINSPAIISPDTTLIKTESYLLIDSSDGSIRMFPVLFLDAYFENDIVYLIVQDMLTRIIRTLKLDLECPEIQEWLMIEIEYYNRLMDYSLIKSYCGNCS